MPIQRLLWDTESQTVNYRGYDVHVIRNGVPTNDLRRALVFESDNSLIGKKSLFDYMTGAGGLDPAAGVILNSVLPSIAGGGAVSFAGGVYSINVGTNYFVQFNTNNWTIVAQNMASGSNCQRNFNFHVAISVTYNGSSGGVRTETRHFRVHIHDDITRAWLTPSTLTVYAGQPQARFAVYAQFSDGTVGDISCHPGLIWPGTGAGSPAAVTNVTFVNDGRINANAALIGGGLINVNVNVDPLAAINNKAGNLTITQGKIVVQNSWSTLAQKYYAIPLGENPQPNPDNAINVIFAADGFKSTDKGIFQGLARDAADFMRFDQTAQPWGLLSKRRINYWCTFLPSRQSGVSCLNEVIPFFQFKENTLSLATLGTDYTFASNQYTFNLTPANASARFKKFAMAVDDYVTAFDAYLMGSNVHPIFEYDSNKTPHPITKATKKLRLKRILTVNRLTITSIGLTLTRLIWRVGLPTPDDLAVSTVPATIRQKWIDLYDSTITTYDLGGTTMVPRGTYDAWMGMSGRFLLNEIDSAFGTATGTKPDMPSITQQFSASRVSSLHPFRSTRNSVTDDLNVLFNNLERGDVPGSPITVWASAGPTFNSTRFIAFLSAGARFAGTNFPRYLSVGLNQDSNSNYQAGTTVPEQELIPYALPAFTPTRIYLNPKVKGVIVHEFAHALQLSDEYAYELTNINTDSDVSLAAGGRLNLMLDPATRTMGQIQGDNLRWRWLRLRGASILRSPITKVGGAGSGAPHLYEFEINQEDAAQFAFATNGLRLRGRALTAITAATAQASLSQYSPELKIEQKTTVGTHVKYRVSVLPDVNNNSLHTSFFFNGGVPVPPGGSNAYIFDQGDLFVWTRKSEYAGCGLVTVAGTVVTGGATVQTRAMFLSQFLPAPAGYKIKIGGNFYNVNTITSENTLTITGPGANIATPTTYEVYPKNDWQEIVHDAFRIAMNYSMNPMTTGSRGDTIQIPNPTLIFSPSLTPPSAGRNNLNNLAKPLNAFRVVGLYNGGAGYVFGVFHPTGWCAMRSSSQILLSDFEKKMTANEKEPNPSRHLRGFCPVCSYIMVDIVDPTCHRENDIFLDTYYPQLAHKI